MFYFICSIILYANFHHLANLQLNTTVYYQLIAPHES